MSIKPTLTPAAQKFQVAQSRLRFKNLADPQKAQIANAELHKQFNALSDEDKLSLRQVGAYESKQWAYESAAQAKAAGNLDHQKQMLQFAEGINVEKGTVPVPGNGSKVGGGHMPHAAGMSPMAHLTMNAGMPERLGTKADASANGVNLGPGLGSNPLGGLGMLGSSFNPYKPSDN